MVNEQRGSEQACERLLLYAPAGTCLVLLYSTAWSAGSLLRAEQTLRLLFCSCFFLWSQSWPPTIVSGSRHARAVRAASHTFGPLVMVRQRGHATEVCTRGQPVSERGLRNASKSAASSLLQLVH